MKVERVLWSSDLSKQKATQRRAERKATVSGNGFGNGFQVFKKHRNSAGYKPLYKHKIAAVVLVSYAWLSNETLKRLEYPDWVVLLSNGTEWAIKKCGADDPNGYKVVDDHNDDAEVGWDNKIIRPMKFLKQMGVPGRFVYLGRMVNDMVVFPTTPPTKACNPVAAR